jgi:hypothetical protein
MLKETAFTMGAFADILQARGQLDDALNIRENHELPVYEKLGDVRSKAVTERKIADILIARGQLDDGARILQERCIPPLKQIGAIVDVAVFEGILADTLWRINSNIHAERVRELLCTALRTFTAAHLPQETAWVQNKLSSCGLSCDGEVNPNLFRTLEDGEALYPDHCDSNALQAGFRPLHIRYFSGSKTITLWTALTLPAHAHQVDEKQFLQLLLASVSLEAEQKAQVIDRFDQLEQEQVDGLVGILQQETEQFSALADEHKPQMDTIQDRKLLEWVAWENQR